MKVEKVVCGGKLCVKINNEIIPPLAFKSFRPSPRNISDFAKAGLKLFCILVSGIQNSLGTPYSTFGEAWTGDGEYDFSVVDKQIDLFAENAPNGYFGLMIHVDTPDWWLKEHPGYKSTFTHLSQTCGNEEWRRSAKAYIQAIIRHTEEKYGERMFGYFLLGGTTTEWFSDRDYEEPNALKEKLFKEYMQDENAQIPPKSIRDDDGGEKFVKDENLVAYRKFSHTLITDTVLYFADAAQEVLEHKKLLGMYYGYIFELYGERIWNAGGLDYERIFASEDIDIISSPSSYMARGYDDTTGSMVAEQSLICRKKFYFLEFDHKTHIAKGEDTSVPIPGFDSGLNNENQTVDVITRDFMFCFTKGMGLWWFDMFGGWFHSEKVMATVKKYVELSNETVNTEMKNISEVVLIAGGEDLYCVNKNAAVNNADLIFLRKNMYRLGAPHDVYSMGDIAKIDGNKYKFYVFADCFNPTREQIDYVNTHFKKPGNVLLFIDSPGYVCGKMKELTGLSLEQTKEHFSNVSGSFGEYNLVACGAPVFCLKDADEVLGKFEDGSAALGSKTVNGCTAAFSSTGNLPPQIFRYYAEKSGVHIYNYDDFGVYANSVFTGIYNTKETVLYVKEDGKYEDVISGKIYTAENGLINLDTGEFRSKLLRKK